MDLDSSTSSSSTKCPRSWSIPRHLRRFFSSYLFMYLPSAHATAKSSRSRSMGRPLTSAEQGGRCRRHPRHRQATGVCPYCLRECLSRLPHHHRHPSTTAYLASSSVSSSPCSSDDDAELSSPEDSSPIHCHSPKSTTRVSFLFRRGINSVASELTRSQSLIFFDADGRKGEEEEEEEEEEKGKKKEDTEKTRKKEKVWWKLMSGSRRWWNNKKESRRVANLMHSQTFKEKPSAKWVLFA